MYFLIAVFAPSQVLLCQAYGEDWLFLGLLSSDCSCCLEREIDTPSIAISPQWQARQTQAQPCFRWQAVSDAREVTSWTFSVVVRFAMPSPEHGSDFSSHECIFPSVNDRAGRKTHRAVLLSALALPAHKSAFYFIWYCILIKQQRH